MQKLDAAFSALANPTRRAILSRLALGEATVTDLARPFRMSQPAVTQHLNVLEEANLLATAWRGTKLYVQRTSVARALSAQHVSRLFSRP